MFWEEYMNDILEAPNDDGNIEAEMRSIRSKLTNTTKMLSSQYKRRRSRGGGGDNRSSKSGRSGRSGTTMGDDPLNKGAKFSVIFVGQWEKEQNWKYVDIWYLIKAGIPDEMRPALWKDLLRR